MKNIKKVTAIFLVMIYAFAVTSCRASEKVLSKINNYLEDEYPGKTFSVKDYTKRNETSGRYEVNASCNEDNIEFQIYIYSTISATDSYSVKRANIQMEKAIREELSLFNKNLSSKFKTIQWLDIYDDNAYNYSFRHVDAEKEYRIADLHNGGIYMVELADGLTIAEVGGAIYDFMNDFYSHTTLIIKDTVFVYTINSVKYEFKTDAKSAYELGKTGVVNELLSNMATSSDIGKNIYTSPIEFEYFSATAKENKVTDD